MAKLMYVTNMSIDGHVEDATGSFDWGEPSEQLHSFFNDLIRPIGTHLYGRSMYEVMTYWETALSVPGHSDVEYEFARIWQNAEKIVYSTTLTSASTNTTSSPRSTVTLSRSSRPLLHTTSVSAAHNLPARHFMLD